VAEVRDIESRRDLRLEYSYPDDEVTSAVLDALTVFADASRGRYANFVTMSGTRSSHDPVTYWWEQVVEPILAMHFRGTKREERAEANATLVEAMIGSFSHVLHHDELGLPITTVTKGSLRSAENEVAQRYGRYYSLRMARWLSRSYGGFES
jgi:hypothetical protein